MCSLSNETFFTNERRRPQAAIPFSFTSHAYSVITISMIKRWAKQTGFMIVELLIVIVVIGILAAITTASAVNQTSS